MCIKEGENEYLCFSTEDDNEMITASQDITHKGDLTQTGNSTQTGDANRTGNLTQTGDINATGEINAKVGARGTAGNINADGNITAKGDLSAAKGTFSGALSSSTSTTGMSNQGLLSETDIDVKQLDTEAKYSLGSVYRNGAKEYIYLQAGGTALTAFTAACYDGVNAENDDLDKMNNVASTTAAPNGKKGDTTVKFSTANPVPADYAKNGFLYINTTTGTGDSALRGEFFQVIKHTGTAAGALDATFTISPALPADLAMAVAGNTTATVVPPPYSNLKVFAANRAPVAFTQKIVPANNYFWGVRRGLTLAVPNAAIAVTTAGDPLTITAAGVAVSGAGDAEKCEGNIGRHMGIGAAVTDLALIEVKL
jgi:hypothetical protein